MPGVRSLPALIVATLFLSTFCSFALANSISIGSVTINDGGAFDGDPSPDRIGLPKIFPGGVHWHTTPGTLIFEGIPGVFASLRLTGTAGPDGIFGTADDVPFDIVCDFLCNGETVTISFSWDFAPIGPIVFDSASLDGSVVSAVPLTTGVKLAASAFGAGLFGTIGPFAGPGAFNGAVAPVLEPQPPVASLSGQLTFTFDDQQVGDLVRLPNSAEVQSVGLSTIAPESPSLVGMALGLGAMLGLGILRPRRKNHLILS
jgi:hypothetical protein